MIRDPAKVLCNNPICNKIGFSVEFTSTSSYENDCSSRLCNHCQTRYFVDERIVMEYYQHMPLPYGYVLTFNEVYDNRDIVNSLSIWKVESSSIIDGETQIEIEVLKEVSAEAARFLIKKYSLPNFL